VVDYIGIASDLKKALAFYSDAAGGKGDPTFMQEKAVELMLEKLEVVSSMYNGFPCEDYFGANTLDLTDFEYAFYTAVADNDSAMHLMQQEKLRRKTKCFAHNEKPAVST